MSDVTDLKAEVLMLRKENGRLRADQAHWELGNCPSCPNVADLQEALDKNAKLQEFAARMARVLDIDGEWRDPELCDSRCMDEFKCRPTGDNSEIRCPAWARLKELGVVK